MPGDVWNPAQYNKFKSQRARPFWDLATLIQPEGVRTVVDLGCGTGELTARLAERLPRAEILGIDNSEAMLAEARRLATPLLHFERRDLNDSDPAGTFDLVFSNAALQWLPDHEALFPRLLRWVAPKGQIAVQMPFNFEHASHRIAHEVACDFEPLKSQALPSRALLSQERYAEILSAAGFLEQRCRLEIYLHPLSSTSEVIEWTKGTLLTFYEKRLSPQDFARFLEIYRDRLLREIGEGPYLYTFKRILIWGRRS